MAAPSRAIEGALEAIERVAEATTIDALVTAIAQPLSRLGVTHFAYGQATDAAGARAPAVAFGRGHEAWRAHYAHAELVRTDPSFPRALRSSDPFSWQALHRLVANDRDAARVFEEARAFGLPDGFVTPIHHLNGSSAAVVMIADATLDWSASERAMAHMLAIYFASCGRALLTATALPARPVLTQRQRECLQWVRAAKTDWEIGAILGLSEHTVTEHLEAARKRLGVRTRAQAVIEAISRGLISI
ncbi:MAG: transcriptional regulator, LuxR family [Alphaproteobacteria bacterium]|nr:MAG: transcriptional regulator LuxR family [Caulobacteraceae bacterium]TPW06628.1 MAG: transcriptional regulator, LuxR family [Alphaproteobacteria bacterium]